MPELMAAAGLLLGGILGYILGKRRGLRADRAPVPPPPPPWAGAQRGDPVTICGATFWRM